MNPLPPTAPHDLCALGARLRASQQLHENSRFQFPGPVHYHHAYTDMWPTTAVNLHHLRLGPWKLYKCSCENCNRPGIHPLLLFKYLRYPVCAPDGWNGLWQLWMERAYALLPSQFPSLRHLWYCHWTLRRFHYWFPVSGMGSVSDRISWTSSATTYSFSCHLSWRFDCSHLRRDAVFRLGPRHDLVTLYSVSAGRI